MFKKCIFAVLAVALMTSVISCKVAVNHDIYSEIYNRYNNFKSYKAEIEVTVKSNLTTKNYTIVQYYKAPDKYREDIIAPDNLKDMKYIYSDGKIKLTPPFSGDNVTMDIPNDKNYMFLPDFFAVYYKSQDAVVSASRDMSGEQTILKATLGGNNIYRFSQSLWVDNKTHLPSKLETYDIKNNPVITVIYKEFKLNEKLDDSLFD